MRDELVALESAEALRGGAGEAFVGRRLIDARAGLLEGRLACVKLAWACARPERVWARAARAWLNSWSSSGVSIWARTFPAATRSPMST